MGHPELLYYGDTLQGDFPLLLVISRGSNNAEPVTPGIGAYDFDEHKSGLWNSTYRLLASVNGLETADVKAVCRERAASPVLFAGCNGDVEQARNVMSQPGIADRITVAIFSGVDAAEYEDTRRAYQAELLERQIPWFHTRLLFGNNMPRIMEELSDPARTKLEWVYRRFLSSAPVEEAEVEEVEV